MNKHNQHAFTIVELLIVIIVISILASVTVVAFNGVRQRAANAAIMAAVNGTEKTLKLHMTQTGSAIRAAVPGGWSAESGSTMSGVCIASTWPSAAELEALTGQNYDNKPKYCGWDHNWLNSPASVTERLDTSIAASPFKESFGKIPSFPAVTINIAGSTAYGVSSYTIRGLRYAFNNSTTNPVSYIHYPYNGKQCASGDVSVKLDETFWPSNNGVEWTGSFTTGGDYTTNGSQSCIRTVRY